MVTAKTQHSLKTAKGYFEEHLSVGDYYEQGQKTSGEWLGLGAQQLGLGGRVVANDFLALCDNQHPKTGERLTQRQRQGHSARRVFYDFTFSPPKSVSIQALIAGDERIVSAHQRAVRAALNEFEAFAATRVRRQSNRGMRVTGNFAAALFTHDASRALDPHLHTHCIVFNATFDPVEQRWKALENHELLRVRKFVENIYYHELAKELRQFGYGIQNRVRGDFEIEGISEKLCERFSKRHNEINGALERLLTEKPELAGGNLKDLREHLATAERSRKQRDVSRAQLKTLWDAQLSAEERASLASLTITSSSEPATNQQTVQSAVEWAEEHLFERRSVVWEYELWTTALEKMRGQPIGLENLKTLTQQRGYLRDQVQPLQLTTKTVLSREWEIVTRAREGVGAHAPFVPNPPTGSTALDTEQQDAFQRLLGSRDFISLFRGGAGTGKSFVLRELTTALREGGRFVQVVAPQRQQVTGLEASGLSYVTTVTDFLRRRNFPERGILVADEAGQIGGRQMAELVSYVASQGGRIIFSGDTRQHGPVEASDALLAIEKHAPVTTAELQQIRRQNPKLGQTVRERANIAAYRRAVAEAAAGKLDQSFGRLEAMGAIMSCRPDEQSQRLAEDYVKLFEQGHKLVVVSQTWSEVNRVNERVRAGLQAKGLVGQDDHLVTALEPIDLTLAQKRDSRSYEGDRFVIFNQNLGALPAGTFGKCLSVGGSGIIVEAGERTLFVRQQHLDRITVCRQRELCLAANDRLQLKANRQMRGGSRVTNGELVTVRRVREDGVIDLADGRVLDASYREFVPGYAVTSYGSQGKTVDYVLFSDSSIKAATNTQQWYVTISRGRRGIRIYTPDKAQLRENILRSGERKLALELSGLMAPASRRRSIGTFLKRFGQHAVRLIRTGRRAWRIQAERKERNEHQTTRMLVR